MHILISGLYACIIWLSGLAYCVIVNGPVFKYLVLSPFIISGVILAILVLDLMVSGIRWLWSGRATLRWWRQSTN